jgi:hypothetical protein
MGLERDAIRCWVAGWADTPGDGWVLAADIRTALANELRERGIASHGLRVVEGPRAAGAVGYLGSRWGQGQPHRRHGCTH